MKMSSIVMPVGFCIGLPIPKNLSYPSDLLISLSEDSEAIKLRNLCQLRCVIYRNWEDVMNSRVSELEDLSKIKFVDVVYEEFKKSNIELIVGRNNSSSYVIKLLDVLCDEISSSLEILSKYLPYWVDDSLVKDLFSVPISDSNYQHQSAANKFRKNIKIYPFQCYININNIRDNTFMFTNDESFITSIYKTAGRDVPGDVKFINDIEMNAKYLNFAISNWKSILVLVDCENVDIHKFISFLNKMTKSNNIKCIALFYDDNANPVWKSLDKYVDIPTEYIYVDRVMSNKSIVDMSIAMYTTKQYYLYQHRYFILASSDSDYCELITSLNGAEFLVLYENEKFSMKTGRRLDKIQTRYLSIDDFQLDTLTTDVAILNDVLKTFCEQYVIMDINTLANSLCTKYHMPADISRYDFIERYINNLDIEVKDNKIKFKINDI